MISEYAPWIRDTLPGQLVIMSNELNHIDGKDSFTPVSINRSFFRMARLKKDNIIIKKDEYIKLFSPPGDWKEYIDMLIETFNLKTDGQKIFVYAWFPKGLPPMYQIAIKQKGVLYSVNYNALFRRMPRTIVKGKIIYKRK